MRLGPKAVDHRAEVQRRGVIIAMQMQRIAETVAQGIAVGHDGRAAARIVKGEVLPRGLERRRHRDHRRDANPPRQQHGGRVRGQGEIVLRRGAGDLCPRFQPVHMGRAALALGLALNGDAVAFGGLGDRIEGDQGIGAAVAIGQIEKHMRPGVPMRQRAAVGGCNLEFADAIGQRCDPAHDGVDLRHVMSSPAKQYDFSYSFGQGFSCQARICPPFREAEAQGALFPSKG